MYFIYIQNLYDIHSKLIRFVWLSLGFVKVFIVRFLDCTGLKNGRLRIDVSYLYTERQFEIKRKESLELGIKNKEYEKKFNITTNCLRVLFSI